METIQYTATDISLHVIDTFDPPSDAVISYEIQAVSHGKSSVSELLVNHDGITTSEIQTAISTNNIRPDEINTDITDHVGRITITPTTVPVTYTINKNVLACNLYSENTKSGRLIKSTEGMGIYATANNMSIRQSNNNFFGNVASTSLSNVVTKNELFSVDNVESYNASVLTTDGDYIIVEASVLYNSSSYVKLTVTPGLTYRVSANSYYTFDGPPNKIDTFDKMSKIIASTTLDSIDLGYVVLTEDEQEHTIDFVATTDTIYVSLGHGVIGTKVYARDVSIKELVPFHTYNQFEGTVYIKWDAVVAGESIITLGNNSVYVDASNNIFINTANCGAQQTTNLLAYRYDISNVDFVINGGSITTVECEYYTDARQLTFDSTIVEFSYAPVLIDDTTLIGLTNV